MGKKETWYLFRGKIYIHEKYGNGKLLLRMSHTGSCPIGKNNMKCTPHMHTNFRRLSPGLTFYAVNPSRNNAHDLFFVTQDDISPNCFLLLI